MARTAPSASDRRKRAIRCRFAFTVAPDGPYSAAWSMRPVTSSRLSSNTRRAWTGQLRMSPDPRISSW